MTVIGEAFIDVKSRSDGFEEGVTGQVSSIAKKAAELFAAGFVLKTGVDFFKGVIDTANDARKILAQTNAVIASTGDVSKVTTEGVEKLATQLSNISGIQDDTVQTGENMLLTFTNIRNGVGKGNDIFNQATKATLDFSVAMGKDMQSSAILVGKALNDPINGLTALHRVGVSFTDQQKEQIKTMVDAGDTMGAQRLILKELNTEFGGSAAAQATAGAKMQAVLHNLKEELGTRLLPVVDYAATLLGKGLPVAFDVLTVVIDGFFSTVKDLRDVFVEAFSFGGSAFGPLNNNLSLAEQVTVRVARAIRELVDGVEQLVEGFRRGTSGGAGFLGFMHDIGLALNVILSAWSDTSVEFDRNDWTGKLAAGVRTLHAVLTPIVDFIEAHMKPILIGLAVAVGLIAAPVTTVVVGLVVLYARFVVVRDIVRDVVGGIEAFVRGAVVVYEFLNANLAPIFARLADTVTTLSALWAPLSEALGHIAVVVRDLAIAIGVVLIPVFLLLRGVWNAVSDDIWNAVQRVWHAIYEVIANVMRAIFDIIKLVLDLINGDWGKAWDDIKALFGAVWDAIYAALAGALGLIASLFGAVLSLLGDVWSAAWNGIKALLEAVWGEILDALGAAGSKFMDIMSTALHGVVSFFEALPGWILDALKALPGLLERAAIDQIAALIVGLLTAAVGVWKFWTEFVPTILGFLADAGTALLGKGVDLIVGLGKGIVDTAEAVFTWFRNLPGVIVDVLGDVGSFLYEQGGDMIRGLGRGITDVAEAVFTWFRDLPGTIANVLGDVGSFLYDHGADMIRGLGHGITDIAEGMYTWFRNLPDTLKGLIGDATSWLRDVGGDIIHGLIHGIEDTAGELIDAIKKAVTDHLPSFVRKALHIDSPSKVFAEIGRNVIAGMALGLSDTGPIDTAMRGLAVTAPNINLGSITGGGGGFGGVTLASGAIRIEQTFAAGTDQSTVDYARDEMAKLLDEALDRAGVGVGRR